MLLVEALGHRYINIRGNGAKQSQNEPASDGIAPRLRHCSRCLPGVSAAWYVFTPGFWFALAAGSNPQTTGDSGSTPLVSHGKGTLTVDEITSPAHGILAAPPPYPHPKPNTDIFLIASWCGL